MGVETDNQEGFKDIVKAAGDFASRVGSGKGVDKEKIHKGKGKGDSSKGKHCRSEARARRIPRVILWEKVESPRSQTKKMERVQKNVYHPARLGRKIQAKVENTGKVVRKKKKTATRMAAKQRKVTSDLD